MRLFYRLLLIFITISAAKAEPTLTGYLEKDLDLKRLALEAEKSNLSLKTTMLDTGFSITLATGTISIYNDGSTYHTKLTPQAKAAIPAASNLTISAQTQLDNGDPIDTVSDTKISLSVDIISSATLDRKLSLIKSKRALTLARRALNNQAITCEKEYYSQLKTLFSAYSAILKEEKDLYDDTIDFEDTKAKGYNPSSSKYRLAQMKVETDEHSIDLKTRKLQKDCAVFANKCGTTFNEGEPFDSFLPKSIEIVEPVNINLFASDTYKETESALYEHDIGILTRRADKLFTLKAGAGYTFNNSTVRQDTVDATLTAGVAGFDIMAGVSLPITSITPLYTAGVTFTPNAILKRVYTNATKKAENETELIAIESARQNYDNVIIERTKSLIDIMWEKRTNTKSFDLYSDVERDMKKNFDAGVITQSAYLSAKTSKEDYRINILINDIDLIIYNDEVKLLFVE